MKINARLVKKLRMERQWSQDQLAALAGLNLRTIQRLENDGKGSMESVRALAAVFNLKTSELQQEELEPASTPFDAVRFSFLKTAEFSGVANRFEYWWFLLFVVFVLAIASVIGEKLLQVISLIVLLPVLSAGTRRLRDAGHSAWWQLMFLVPFGQPVVLWLLSQRSRGHGGESDEEDVEPA